MTDQKQNQAYYDDFSTGYERPRGEGGEREDRFLHADGSGGWGFEIPNPGLQLPCHEQAPRHSPRTARRARPNVTGAHGFRAKGL